MPPAVARRQVFYIPGYDPIHPRRYRELYRKESAVQGAISEYRIALKARRRRAAYGWQVNATIEGRDVETDVEVMVWSDIVRDSMGSSIAATYLQLARTAWVYLWSGALFRLMRLRKGPVIAALYPVGFLLVQLMVAALIGGVIGGIFNWAARGARLDGLSPWIGILVGLGVMPFVLGWFKTRDSRFYAYYLMHDYSFSARGNGANPEALEARMAQFRERIGAALKGDAEEVLVVGHSSGAHLAVSVLADLLRNGELPEDGPVLSFLSLGQVVPMVSFLPGARRLRRDLAYLAMQDRVFWLDVSAPGDGCAFALCDPVAVSGVAQAGKRWPLVISAAFSESLTPERWAELRWRFFRVHFQYLCAFDRPRDYDYFRITAGPQTLAQRYAGRSASPARIERAVNRHTSVAP
ncbi:hypothetical protein DL237_00215 [Pseudooceanicola sediminis]|uniref:Alpha/beta hydrolase n=1 Tax=Pseudooceanicola sediminis TaxID=2211117 RepID=A0A399JDU0_9RHOB|nr:hypothetical protein E0K93_02330 [Puniceibacterium sp. HSS470]RII40796.1 hypothetical protein DL237_00215 [Pseudooceanicola sediminis]